MENAIIVNHLPEKRFDVFFFLLFGSLEIFLLVSTVNIS